MKRRDWRYGLVFVCSILAFCGLMVSFVVSEGSYHTLESLPAVETQPPKEVGKLVNINMADVEELCTLYGIGPKKAEAILAYREEHGPFRYPEELVYVSGIGEITLERIIDSITTGGLEYAENSGG